MLRFRCPVCQTLMEVPARRVGDKIVCKGCERQVEIPAPPSNRTVLGAFVATRSEAAPPRRSPPPAAKPAQHEPARKEPIRVRFSCPHCPARIRVPATLQGQPVRCPNCRATITVPTGRAKAPPPPIRRPESVEEFSPREEPGRPAGHLPTKFGPDQEAGDVLPAEEGGSEEAEEGEEPEGANVFRRESARGGALLDARWTRRLVGMMVLGGYLVVLLGPGLVGFSVMAATGVEAYGALGCCCWPVPVLLVGLLGVRLFRWLADQLAALMVGSVRCPGCEDELPAMARWACACGYCDHREQHYLTFRCPMCRCLLGDTHCPRCESTIFLR